MADTETSPAPVAKSKLKVTMIQSPDGVTRRVRIGDAFETDVLICGPVVGLGQMNFNVTLADIDLAYEKADAVA